MMSCYSAYRNGLKVGDLVTYKQKSMWNFYDQNSSHVGIILEKNFLFSNNTRWGKRKFYEYKMINFENKIYYIKTQQMRILKRTGAL